MSAILLPPSEWMERLIRINSVTDRSNVPVIKFLIPLLEKAGLHTKTQTVRENGKEFVNLFAFNKSLDAKNLLAMNTHLDTVGGGSPKNWTKAKMDPWRLTRSGDRLYGLGAADVKLDFLCKLAAAQNARGTERPFVLVGTYGEERGLVGITKVFAKPWIRPASALVGEPSNLELIYAHKGHLICTLALKLDKKREKGFRREWRGQAAHSSTPHLGVNAIQLALIEIAKSPLGVFSLEGGIGSNTVADRCVAELGTTPAKSSLALAMLWNGLRDLAAEIGKERDRRFTPAFNTLSVNWAQMEANELRLTFDIRLLPCANARAIQTKVEKLAHRHGAKIRMLSIDLPLEGKKEGKFLKAAARQLRSCGVTPLARTKASSTEAAVYGDNGADAIVFGPGVSIGNVHRPNEHNLLSHLEIATRFYTGMLKAPLREY